MSRKLKNTGTFISGHSNPDIDSPAAAAALAVLRGRHSDGHFIPICPGVMPERARYLFEKFHIKPPLRRNDVYIQGRSLPPPEGPA